jgi:hypothetical protein
MHKIILTFFFCIVSISSIFGQESGKLVPDGNRIKIIGTRYSVDYDNNNRMSETVNNKENVFDGNYNTFFASYDRSYTWAGLDLGEKHVITKVAFCPRSGWSVRLRLGVLEGANTPDFGDAVPLGIITASPPENTMMELTVENSRGYRYVRYISPNDVRCNIAELAFYGYRSDGNDDKLTQTTNIPDVIIHTVNAEEVISKETYLKGIVSFISGNGTEFYSDSLEIRGRGNASWNFPKKPYRLKLYNSTSPLGHPAKAKNWTLINNYGDKTLIRNLLAFDISKRLEMPYTPAGRPVNVYFNGEYKGCYQFCDHIDVRKNRVDIKEMDENDRSGTKLTGGYLIEVDAYANTEKLWFSSSRNNIPVTVKSPDDDAITHEQKDYIINYFNTFENSVYTGSSSNFRNYLDIQTFIRHFLIGELSGNTDTYWSVYMYKPRENDKFYTGPIWDFDLAFENDNRTHPINIRTDWICKTAGSFPNDGTRDLFHKIINNLQPEIADTWKQYRNNGQITEESLLKTVSDYATETDASQRLNFIRWDILNTPVHQNFQALGSYSAEISVVENFIKERIKWIDNKLGYIVSSENINLQDLYLWAENSTIHIDGIQEPVTIEVFDLMGRNIFSRQEVSQEVNIPYYQGVVFVRISDSKGNNKVFKCMIK